MLNTKLQGNEGVLFLLYWFIVPQINTVKEWDIMSRTKEVEDHILVIQARVSITTPYRVHLSLNFYFISKKKKERHSPYLLAGFSHIGIPRVHIVLIVWMVCSFYYCIFFSIFSIYFSIVRVMIIF
jgi:hypothetical protein